MSIGQIKRFIIWAFLGLLLTWLVSCNSSPPSPSQPEVEFWTMQLQPQFTTYFNQIISNFEKDNPQIKVRWVDIPWSAMESKILTAVSAKTAPDIVNLNPSFASGLASKNAWLNLNQKVTPDVQKLYLPKVWAASTLNDLSFGIPWYLTTQVTICNQDLLKKAGLDQAPKTFTELAKIAPQIKQKTGKYPLFISFVPGDSNEVLESLVSMGVTLLDQNNKAAFNTPQGLAAFKFWVDLFQADLLPPEVLTQGHRQAIELYQAGEIAFLSTGPEFIDSIKNNAPTIAEVSTAAPQITGETGKKNVAVMNLIIPQDSDQIDNALKFALFVTNSDNQLAFAKQANVLPSTEEAVSKYIQELEAETNLTALQNARKVSAMQLKDAEVLIPPVSNINQLQQIIYQNLQAAMLKEKTVEQAVSDAANEWNNLS
jgi:putative chitobiose transport system substrate-binding protein